MTFIFLPDFSWDLKALWWQLKTFGRQRQCHRIHNPLHLHAWWQSHPAYWELWKNPFRQSHDLKKQNMSWMRHLNVSMAQCELNVLFWNKIGLKWPLCMGDAYKCKCVLPRTCRRKSNRASSLRGPTIPSLTSLFCMHDIMCTCMLRLLKRTFHDK